MCREIVEQSRLLRDDANTPLDPPGFVGVIHLLAQDAHRAARGGQQTCKHFDSGRFSRAVGAEKAVELPRFDAQIKTVHCAQIAKAAGQSICFDSKNHHGCRVYRHEPAKARLLLQLGSVLSQDSSCQRKLANDIAETKTQWY
jgi:hypothetical protein